MDLPEESFILLSYVNTKLRDEYPNLEAFCEDFGVERADLVAKLGAAGFEYVPEINQFR